MNKVYVTLALTVCLSHWLRSARRSVTGPSGFAIVVAFSIGLLAVVAAGTWHINTAFASPVDYCSPGAYTGAIVARDGKRLSDQTADVRELFANTWGEDAAARWVFEHNCTLGSGYAPQTPSISDQCPYTEYTGALEARDGTTLIDQPAHVQDLFVITWGSHAAARWVYEHNCGLGPERSPGTTSQSQQSGQADVGPERSPGTTSQSQQSRQADIRVGSALDPTPTPEPSSSSDSDSSSNPISGAPWHGFYVEGDIDGSWGRLCHAFMDYRVPPSHVYDSGNEALNHPLLNEETNMYMAECQRSPR